MSERNSYPYGPLRVWLDRTNAYLLEDWLDTWCFQWIHLAEQGRCDEIEGVEFWRVTGEAIAARLPLDRATMVRFIIARANVGPGDPVVK